ncbi:MAG TPA: hypothetical protein VFX59_14455 [Polyangiales bacterium]|nr:hypothetical protein [Polyangiales bacterium]
MTAHRLSRGLSWRWVGEVLVFALPVALMLLIAAANGRALQQEAVIREKHRAAAIDAHRTFEASLSSLRRELLQRSANSPRTCR